MSEAYLVFELEGDHIWAPVLGRFKHVWAIVRDDNVFIGVDFINGRVRPTYQGTDAREIVEHHQNRGAVVVRRDVSEGACLHSPIVHPTCVELVKVTLGIPGIWILTPGQLYAAVQEEIAEDGWNNRRAEETETPAAPGA